MSTPDAAAPITVGRWTYQRTHGRLVGGAEYPVTIRYETDVLASSGGPIGPAEDELLTAYLAAMEERDRLRAENATLRDMLRLRPSGRVGAHHEIPWFQHCGISHARGAECVVCAALEAK